uniref:Cytochrome P450 n=1 Tax=Oryza nivara TaxID=4536 RepID=A0A0E0G3N8_ORYNI
MICHEIFKVSLVKAKQAAAGIPPPPLGPWRLPVIGSMHHLAGKLPHRVLRDLAAAHGPLMMLQLGETPLVVASSREVAREVLRTHDANFATPPQAARRRGRALRLRRHPLLPYWRKLQQLCAAEVLGPKRVLSFRHIREQEVGNRRYTPSISIILGFEQD